MEPLQYFKSDYASSRQSFVNQAQALLVKEKFNRAQYKPEFLRVPVASLKDSDLSVDLLYLPAQAEKKNLLILSSGIHGIEGLAGSAVQNYFLRRCYPLWIEKI